MPGQVRASPRKPRAGPWTSDRDLQAGLTHLLGAHSGGLSPVHKFRGRHCWKEGGGWLRTKTWIAAGRLMGIRTKKIGLLTLTWVFKRSFVSGKPFLTHWGMSLKPFQIFPKNKLEHSNTARWYDQHLWNHVPQSGVQTHHEGYRKQPALLAYWPWVRSHR